jgi:hypothetical protein
MLPEKIDRRKEKDPRRDGTLRRDGKVDRRKSGK